MPKPFPEEFRRDVVAVARKREAPLTQIAKDFGISEPTLHNWLKKADIEDGNRPGMTKDESAELREAKKRIQMLDRGSQFRSRKFVHALSDNGLQGSMGRVGACGDNAAMESFFSLLQKNVLDRQRWSTQEQLRLAIVTWIEKTYHRKRRQRRLGKLTPIEFETINEAAHAA